MTDEPTMMGAMDPTVAWKAGYDAAMAERSCPGCGHGHLDTLAEEPCEACGCALYPVEGVMRIVDAAVDSRTGDLRRLLEYLWGATGFRSGSLRVMDLFSDDDPIVEDVLHAISGGKA